MTTPIGYENKDTIWINNSGTWVEFPIYTYLYWRKTENKKSEFEIEVVDISPDKKVYFKETAEVLIFCGTTMVLKGRIEKIDYLDDYTVRAQGFGMEVKLEEKQFIKDGDNRVQYDNTSAKTIITDINSDILTTASSGIFSSDFGNISMRYEYGNRLDALIRTVDAIDYYWWVSQTSSNTYSSNYLNVSPTQGSTSSVKTFDLSNCEFTNNRDTTQLVNYVNGLGYGDGVNQLSTYVYAASTQSSFLSANINATNTSIPVVNSSVFNTTGSVRIAKEIINYAGKSGNNLTGCTRGISGSTAKAHNKGCYIEQHYLTSSAQSGSSIYTYGLKDYTYIDKTIIDEETLETVISKYLYDRKDVIQTIHIDSVDPLIDGVLNIGDLVTVTSSEANLNGSYHITNEEFKDDNGEISFCVDVSNVPSSLIESLDESKKEQQNSEKYMQGATNIYCLNTSENLDSSHPLYMRFYIPSKAVAINDIKLSFKMKNYRADSESVTSTPIFWNNTQHFFSSGRAFNIGNPIFSSGFVRNLSLSTTSVVQRLNYTSGFLRTSGTLYSYDPYIFVDNKDSSGHINSWWYIGGTKKFIASSSSFYSTSVCTSESTINAVTGWSYSTTSVINGYTTSNWTYPLELIVPSHEFSEGIFDKIVVNITAFNGYDETKNPTIYLQRETSKGSGSYTTITTFNPTLLAWKGDVEQYIETTDYSGYNYRLLVYQPGFNVNHTDSPDDSYLILSVSTYMKSVDQLNFGIYENTSEFTPPGKIILSTGQEGSETVIGTYSSDQSELDITNSYDWIPGNWYVIKFNSNHTDNASFGGRMRIEANLYTQIFIKSE